MTENLKLVFEQKICQCSVLICGRKYLFLFLLFRVEPFYLLTVAIYSER